MLRPRRALGDGTRTRIHGDLGPGRSPDRQAQALPRLQGHQQGLEAEAAAAQVQAVVPQPAAHAGAELEHPTIGLHHREGRAEVKTRLVGPGVELQHGPSQELQGGRHRRAAEAGHVAALVKVAPLHQAGIEAQVAAPAGQGTPGVVDQQQRRRRLGGVGPRAGFHQGQQASLLGIDGGQALAVQPPDLAACPTGRAGQPEPRRQVGHQHGRLAAPLDRRRLPLALEAGQGCLARGSEALVLDHACGLTQASPRLPPLAFDLGPGAGSAAPGPRGLVLGWPGTWGMGLGRIPGRRLEVTIEEGQLQAIEATAPIEMGPGTDAQQGLAPGPLGLAPEVEHAIEVGVVPAADQQQGLTPERGGRLMAGPAGAAGGVAPQPGQPHGAWVVALKQGQPLAQEAAGVEAGADLLPGLVIVAAAAAQGCQLQGPGQLQGPPMGTALAGPVQPFIQASHGRRQGIEARSGILQQQLGEALVGKPVAPHLAIAPALAAQPGQGRAAIGRLLAEPSRLASGVAPTTAVLHHHGIAVAPVPLGMGIGHRGGDRPAVGLAHQQGRPGAGPGGQPDAAGQGNAVGGLHPSVLNADIQRSNHRVVKGIPLQRGGAHKFPRSDLTANGLAKLHPLVQTKGLALAAIMGVGALGYGVPPNLDCLSRRRRAAEH